MSTFSAPAKVHVIGEHSVVHHYPALIAAINLTCTAQIEKSSVKTVLIDSKAADKQIVKLTEILEKEIASQFKLKIPPYKLKIKSNIPIGKGLGSSAALSATITGALLKYLSIKFDPQTVQDIAHFGERYFHGNPSGGDLASVVNGGLIWFRKENELIKIIKPLPFSPSKKLKPFILIDSGKPIETTKVMVEKVQKLLNRRKETVENIFKDQETLTRNILSTLKKGNGKELIKIIRKANKNLVKIGVVSQKAQDFIDLIEKRGGAGKISGAGGIKDGSGMILAYHPNPNALIKLANEYALPTIKVKFTEKGIYES